MNKNLSVKSQGTLGGDQSYGENWDTRAMTPLARYLEIIRWSSGDLADHFGINKRTVFRWLNGQNDTPDNVLVWARELAEFHLAHGLPDGWSARIPSPAGSEHTP
jgi:hypothetical protein